MSNRRRHTARRDGEGWRRGSGQRLSRSPRVVAGERGAGSGRASSMPMSSRRGTPTNGPSRRGRASLAPPLFVIRSSTGGSEAGCFDFDQKEPSP